MGINLTVGIAVIVVVLQGRYVSSFTSTSTNHLPGVKGWSFHMNVDNNFESRKNRSSRNFITVATTIRQHKRSQLQYKDETRISTDSEQQQQEKQQPAVSSSMDMEDIYSSSTSSTTCSSTRRAMAMAAAFGQKYEGPKVYNVTTVQKFFYTLLDIWGVIAFGLGVALSMGLLLNILGFAYYLTPQQGLVIDTFEHLRMARELTLMP
jgi:hypothetical protein